MTAEALAWTIFVAGFFLICCVLAWLFEHLEGSDGVDSRRDSWTRRRTR